MPTSIESAQVDVRLPAGWSLSLSATSAIDDAVDENSLMASFSYHL